MRSRKRSQSGSTIIEFALVFPFLLTMFFGSVGIGIPLVRHIKALQIGRDIAHMYADGVDFTQIGNRNIAVQLAAGTGMTINGGNAVIILSHVQTVYQADCTAAGLASCGNLGSPVVIQRVIIGNTGLYTSPIANISCPTDAAGNISAANYLNNCSDVRSPLFSTLLANAGTSQAQGDIANVAEVYISYPDISFLGYYTPTGAYVRFIF